jgi:predicted AlkP superfamily pyrophosphatase or phosphodiesterase
VVFEDAVLGVDIPDTPAGRSAQARLLLPHDHLTCWRKADIPARFHYGTNPRVPDVICAAQTGWLVQTRERAARRLPPERGAHGYDNADPLMGALFVAEGPDFRQGLVIAPFPNVDVYPLMMEILGLPPEPNDGRLADLAPIRTSPSP